MAKPKPQKKSAAAKAAAASNSNYTRSGKNGKQVELDRLMAAADRKSVEKAAQAKEEERIQRILAESEAQNAESQIAEAAPAQPASAGIDELFAQLRQESEVQAAADEVADAEKAAEDAKKAEAAETALIKKSSKTLSEDLMSHIRLAGKMDLVRRFRELVTRDKDDVFFRKIEPSRGEIQDEICKDLVKELSKSELPANWWTKWTAGISAQRRWEILRNMLQSDAASADNDRCHARISVFRGLLTKLAAECGYHSEWWKLSAADPRSMMVTLRGYAEEILATSIAKSIVERAQAILPMLNGIITVPATVTNAIWQISCLEKAAKKKTDAVFAGKTLGKWLYINDGIHGKGLESWLLEKANSTQRLALANQYGIGTGIRITSLAQSVFAQLGMTTAEEIQSFVDETLGIRRESDETEEPAEVAAPAESEPAEESAE